MEYAQRASVFVLVCACQVSDAIHVAFVGVPFYIKLTARAGDAPNATKTESLDVGGCWPHGLISCEAVIALTSRTSFLAQPSTH